MVKIRDIKDEELLKSILKYKKILDKLYKERALRLEKNPALKTVLLTSDEAREIKEVEKESTTKDESSIFQLSINEDELPKANEMVAAKEKAEKLRVTQILKLTPEQLKEFNASKEEEE